MKINSSLREILKPSYPCKEFIGRCSSAELEWNPSTGHVPRGYIGGYGSVEQIELVLVLAEPGFPWFDLKTGIGEKYSETPAELIIDEIGAKDGYVYPSYVGDNLDFMKMNIKYILDNCFPGASFDEQLKRAWITESVLCSLPKGRACRQVNENAEAACVENYLTKQYELLQHAYWIALGKKAQGRLKMAVPEGAANIDAAYAPTLPGARRYYQKAVDSWSKASINFHKWIASKR